MLRSNAHAAEIVYRTSVPLWVRSPHWKNVKGDENSRMVCVCGDGVQVVITLGTVALKESVQERLR